MELSLLLAKQFFSMALIIVLGFLLVRFRVFHQADIQGLSRLLVYVITPCAIFGSYQIEFSQEKLSGLWFAIVFALGTHLLFILLAFIARKLFHLQAVDQASLIYTNAGNLIIPLVSTVLGHAWVFYATAYLLVQIPLMWTHGQTLISGQRCFSPRKILCNINIQATCIGLLTFILHLQLPSVVLSPINSIGDTIGPVNMLVIGMLLAGCDLKQTFTSVKTYLTSFLRLLLFPLLLVLIIAVAGLAHCHPQGKQLLLIALLAASAPPASVVVQLAQIFDNHADYASALNTFMVLCCIVTMPLVIFAYQWIMELR